MSPEDLVFPKTLGSLLPDSACIAREADVSVMGIASDSRLLKEGDLFIAYKDPNIDTYIASAIESHVNAIIVEAERSPDNSKYNIPVIASPQLRTQAGSIAAQFYDYPTRDINVIGVTGTNGKTTVSYLIAQAFELYSQGSSGFIGTLGYGPVMAIHQSANTTPEPVTLQRVFADLKQQGINTVVIEVSSHGLDQHRVAGVEFDMAIFTNLSRDHLDYHQTMKNYAQSKRRLFSDYSVKKAVINFDDEYGIDLTDEFHQQMDIIGYTLEPNKQYQSPVVKAKIISDDGLCMKLDIDSPWGKGVLTSSLTGSFNASNLLASLSALCLSGISFSNALLKLSQCLSAPGRMECFRQENMPLIVIDYAHTPDSLKQVLQTIRCQLSGRLVCVFGCGGQRDNGKRAEMGRIAEQYADQIFLTNDNPRNESPQAIIADIAKGITDHQCLIKDTNRREAIAAAIWSASPDDTVLIAGKGHEDYQEIAGVKIPLSDRLVVKEILKVGFAND